AFLEGGAAYATSLYGDLAEQYELRNRASLAEHLTPTNVDVAELARLWDEYASPAMVGKFDAALGSINPMAPHHTAHELASRDAGWDDFAQVPSADDIKSWFTERLFFGTEAEDKTMSYAFDGRVGARLRPVLGSDVGHYDVQVCA